MKTQLINVPLSFRVFCVIPFQVETVGDCYVAVAGLPDPRRDHAVVMAKFARQCLLQLSKLTKQLEVMLGPDTADLTMRIGLHSGPVTAGVLRGDRPRFQLFGKTKVKILLYTTLPCVIVLLLTFQLLGILAQGIL